jgi:hypothetical protein
MVTEGMSGGEQDENGMSRLVTSHWNKGLRCVPKAALMLAKTSKPFPSSQFLPYTADKMAMETFEVAFVMAPNWSYGGLGGGGLGGGGSGLGGSGG